MHAHKIISRHVKKGVMAGKNNRFGHHHPMRRQKAMLFYRLDGRMLVNFQMGSDCPQKVQGVETRLSVKADRSADRKREFGTPSKVCLDAQPSGHLCLPDEGFLFQGGIQIGRTLGECTVNVQFRDQSAVVFQCLLIGVCVLLSQFFAKLFD